MTAARDQYIECRVGGKRHAWEDHDGTGFRRPQFGVALHLQCSRCGTVRRDIVDRFRGDLLQRRYYHPEGYEMAQDERPTTEQVRLAVIKKQREVLKAAPAGARRRRKA